MAFLAARTIPVGACEGQLVASVGFELTRLATAANERTATVGTGRAVSGFGLPVGSFTLKRQIFEHAGAQAIPALIERLLDFS